MRRRRRTGEAHVGTNRTAHRRGLGNEAMATAMSTADLARDREQAAADLEAAIADLGMVFRRFQRLTKQLEDQGHVELARHLDVALSMHLHAAGLATFLDRKLVSPATGPPSLRDLVARQHAQLPIRT